MSKFSLFRPLGTRNTRITQNFRAQLALIPVSRFFIFFVCLVCFVGAHHSTPYQATDFTEAEPMSIRGHAGTRIVLGLPPVKSPGIDSLNSNCSGRLGPLNTRITRKIESMSRSPSISRSFIFFVCFVRCLMSLRSVRGLQSLVRGCRSTE